MNIALTNLSDENFSQSRLRLNASAGQHGIEIFFSYHFEDIKRTPFYSENEVILSQPTGLGYWLWKPYIILESLKKVNDGDLVIYSDSGIEIIASLDPLIQICEKEQPILLFANGNLINAEWTKRDCFILMDCDQRACWKAQQVDAAFGLFRKTDKTINFVKEWLDYGKDRRILTDIPNELGKKNSWRFIDHRWDQSILSLLAYKYKLNLYRMPTQFGNHYKSPPYRITGEFNCISQKRLRQVNYYSSKPFYNSPYSQLLDHHRSRKVPLSGKQQSLLKKIESRIRQWL